MITQGLPRPWAELVEEGAAGGAVNRVAVIADAQGSPILETGSGLPTTAADGC